MPNTRMTAIAAQFDSHGLEKVAIIKAETKGSMANTELRPAIGKALAEWIEQTEEGKLAFKEHGVTLNIGHLHDELPCASLEPFLARQGIFSLDVVLAVDEISDESWTFQKPLMELAEVPTIASGNLTRQGAKEIITAGDVVRWKHKTKELTVIISKVLPNDMYVFTPQVDPPTHPVLLSEITHVLVRGEWFTVSQPKGKKSHE